MYINFHWLFNITFNTTIQQPTHVLPHSCERSAIICLLNIIHPGSLQLQNTDITHTICTEDITKSGSMSSMAPEQLMLTHMVARQYPALLSVLEPVRIL